MFPEAVVSRADPPTHDGDRWEMEDEEGHKITFDNHGFGLLTMTNAREQVFSTQPALLVPDGEGIRSRAFPYPQELWEAPNDGTGRLWSGVPVNPRRLRHMPRPVFRHRHIPFRRSNDPPAVYTSG